MNENPTIHKALQTLSDVEILYAITSTYYSQYMDVELVQKDMFDKFYNVVKQFDNEIEKPNIVDV